MMHPSLEPDTLFLVFEEDWRISSEEAVPQTVDVPADAPGFKVHGSRPIGRHHYIPYAGSYPSKQEHGTVVGDLVSIVIKASRADHGDLVWMTWQPGQGDVKRGVTKIKSGAMLIALSVRGAKTISQAMENSSIKKDHFDIGLLRYLEMEGSRFSSYVFPPLGNYSAHVSGCEPHFAVNARPSCWDAKWVCPGTRREDDPQHRDKYLAAITKKGEPKWLGKFDLEREYGALEWVTHWSVPGVVRPDRKKDSVAPALMDTALDADLTRVLREVLPARTDRILVFTHRPVA